MVKLIWRLLILIALGAAFAWLADRPETLTITSMGRAYEVKIVVAAALAIVALAVLYVLWRMLSRLWQSPRTAREYWRFRRHKKAYENLSRGLIAASAGDAQAAGKLAGQARATLTDEPLLNLLSAQAAQLKGDRAAVKQAFEDMLKRPETEVLGLRGLFAEAKQAGDYASAIRHAERALAVNPRLAWASAAMLQIQTARKDWEGAAATIASQGKSGLLPRSEADRKRASLLAAEALNIEDSNRALALSRASDAHALDPALVPAALVAARCHIANGSTRKALRVLRDTWSKSPHPELAEVAAHARPGESPEDRFERVRDLVGDADGQLEAAHALARSAVQARRFEVARKALQPHINETPQARLCELMAIIEEASDDKGRAREWLARAIHAPRDPMWVSDGVASPRWTPVSPVTGEIVPCEWKTPFEMLGHTPVIPDFPAQLQPAQATAALPQNRETMNAITAPPPADDPGVTPDDPRN